MIECIGHLLTVRSKDCHAFISNDENKEFLCFFKDATLRIYNREGGEREHCFGVFNVGGSMGISLNFKDKKIKENETIEIEMVDGARKYNFDLVTKPEGLISIDNNPIAVKGDIYFCEGVYGDFEKPYFDVGFYEVFTSGTITKLCEEYEDEGE